MTKGNGQRMFNKLATSIELLARVLCDLGDALALHKNNKAILDRIALMEKNIMATQKELVEQAKLQSEAIAEIGLETDTLIKTVKDLQDAVNNQANADPALVEAMAAVTAQLKVVADKVPGKPGEVPPPPPDVPTPA